MASEQGELEGMVVTGFRRKVRIVALKNASEGLAVERVGEGGFVGGGVGGRRSLAASQSSSTNYSVSELGIAKVGSFSFSTLLR